MPSPLPPIGFWSYSREDDRRADGKLSQLRSLLTKELEGLYGRFAGVRLHQDLSVIEYGNLWEAKIEEALSQCSFMIAIVTPDFFQSEWCCKEVKLFQAREKALGRSGLIFPIEYISVARMDRTLAHDPMVWDRMSKTQMVRFSDWRHYPPDTTLEIKLLLADLAQKIVDKLAEVVGEKAPAPEPPPSTLEPKSKSPDSQPAAAIEPGVSPPPAIILPTTDSSTERSQPPLKTTDLPPIAVIEPDPEPAWQIVLPKSEWVTEPSKMQPMAVEALPTAAVEAESATPPAIVAPAPKPAPLSTNEERTETAPPPAAVFPKDVVVAIVVVLLFIGVIGIATTVFTTRDNAAHDNPRPPNAAFRQ